MITRVRRIRGLLRAIIYVLPPIAFLIAGYQRFGYNAFLREYANGSYLYILLFATVVWPFLADRYAISSFQELYTENTAIVRSLFACGILFLLNSAMLHLAHFLLVSRLFLVIACVNLLLLSVITRSLFRWALVGPSRKFSKPLKVLIVGADRYAHWAAIRINSMPLANCKVAAFVALEGQTIRVKGAQVIPLNEIDELNEVQFDNVFVAVGPDRYAEVAKLYNQFKGWGRPIYGVLDFGSRIHIREMSCQIGRLQVVNLEPSATESFGYSVAKRIFDLLFSLAGLVFLSPVMGLIALLIRLSSPGPILFKQERIGLNGRSFIMYKFRTMRCAETRDSDRLWTTQADPRRTKLGVFLRRTSLDELPQLLNVLKGEMSIVGPRPERPHFVSQFRTKIERYDMRHRAKVGITGWAQVNGLRGDTSIKKRVNYDVYYLKHWTFGFDLRIIFLTIRSMLFDQNAY